ncbi:MAG: ACP phosphodiesterase [Calditrichia bacterium]
MNFLAHLFLADKTPHSILGNMLADFVDGNFRETYPTEICRGIILHRKIDAFTDKHDIFLRSMSRLNNDYRRLKGIMVDMFYDHFLAKNWSDFSDDPLEDFCDYVYSIFLENQSLAPERLRKIIPRMVTENWLFSYRKVEGIQWALEGLSRRLSRKNNLGASIQELKLNYQDLQHDFYEFFPLLIEYVEGLKLNPEFPENL